MFAGGMSLHTVQKPTHKLIFMTQLQIGGQPITLTSAKHFLPLHRWGLQLTLEEE